MEGSDKQKCCWFPFKEAYTRRRITPEQKEKPYEYRGQTLALYDYDETGSQQQNGGTEVMLDTPTTRAFLTSCEDTGIVDGNAAQHQQNIASINPNCLNQEFWVDEIVESGPWACMEQPMPLKQRKQVGPPVSPPTSPQPRIEVVADLDRSASLDNSIIDRPPNTVSPVMRRAMCGSMPRIRKGEKDSKFVRTVSDEESEATDLLNVPTLGSEDDDDDGSEPPKTPPRTSSFLNTTCATTSSALYIPKMPNNRSFRCGSFDLRSIRQQKDPDEIEPTFYIEVEATPEQLNEIRDIDEIDQSVQAKNERKRDAEVVEMARASSLVDADSAFGLDSVMMREEEESTASPSNVSRKLRSQWSGPIPEPHAIPVDSSILKSPSSEIGTATDVRRSQSASSRKSKDLYTPQRARSFGEKSHGAASVSSNEEMARNMSNLSLKRTMSEKVSRRLRSFGRSPKRNSPARSTAENDDGDDEDNDLESKEEVKLRKGKSFSRVEMSELTTDSEFKHARQERLRARAFGRVAISELTTDFSRAESKAFDKENANRLQHRNEWIDFDATSGILRAASLTKDYKRSNHDEPDWEHGPPKEPQRHGVSFRPDLEDLPEHPIRRAQSLDESFTNAIPFDPNESEFSAGFDNAAMGHHDLSYAPQEINPDDAQLPDRPPSRKTKYFDDDSGLGTEAFNKYEADDEDSIFSDLKTVGEESQPEVDGSVQPPPPQQPTPIEEPKEINRVKSTVSRGDHSTYSRGEMSRYSRGGASRYSRGDLSKYSVDDASRYSRGDLSRYSRYSKYSRGDLSAYSRGNLTAHTDFYSAANDGPFSCMDKWLD